MTALTANITDSQTLIPVDAGLTNGTFQYPLYFTVDSEAIRIVGRAHELTWLADRAIAGTTAATHLSAATLTRYYPDGATGEGAGGVTVDNQVDAPAEVTTIIAAGAALDGDEATLHTFPGGWLFDTGNSDFLHNEGAGILIGDLTENVDFTKVESGRVTIEKVGGGTVLALSSADTLFEVGSSDGVLITDAAAPAVVFQALGNAMGFFGATPAAQPAAIADATDPASTMARLNDLLAALRDLGLIDT